MKDYNIGPVLEDIVAKGLNWGHVALRHEVKIEDIQILMKHYYGEGEYQLKSFNCSVERSLLEIKKYNSNNLTIIDENSLILEY